MRGSTRLVFASTLLATGMAASTAHAHRLEDPLGPAAAATPPVTANPDGSAPAPAPFVAPAAPIAPAAPPAAPGDPDPVPVMTLEPSPAVPADDLTMRDPFRPDAGGTALSPRGTTTTTTTVVVTDRVRPMPYNPPQSQPQSRERIFIGGYGGFGGRLGPTSGRLSVFSNFRGGLLIGKRLSIGGSLVQMTKRLGAPIKGTSGREYQLGLAYGGVQVGLVALRRGRFEIGVDSLFGVGVACIYDRHRDAHGRSACLDSVKLFVAEPGAFIHFNLTDWMRVGFNGGYRFVGRQAWASGANFRLASPYFGANLDFGWFRRRDT
jgi:hypothetical protein